MRTYLTLTLALLASCATRTVPDALPATSPLSAESPSAALDEPAVALREDPPLPDEPEGSPLWRSLADPDAAVIPLPTEPGQSWGGAEPGAIEHTQSSAPADGGPSQGVHSHHSHGGHSHHGR